MTCPALLPTTPTAAPRERPSSPTPATTRLDHPPAPRRDAEVPQQAGGHLRACGMPRSAVFESARRLARWHYQWIVTHEFLPAIVGTDHDGLGVQGSARRAPRRSPSSTTSRRTPRGAPSSRSSSRWPRTASATASPGPATPSGTSSTAAAPTPGLCLERAAVRGRAQRQQLERAPRVTPPRLKIQWSKFFNDPWRGTDAPHCSARAPVRRFAGRPTVQDAQTALPDTNNLGLLSQRNLRRGRKMGLPSGQQVARLMGVTPLTNAQLWTEPPHQGEHPDCRQQVGARRSEGGLERVRRGRTRASRRSSPIRSGAARRRCGSTSSRRPRSSARAAAGPCRRADRGRGSRRPVAEGPQLVSVLESAWKPAPPIAPVRGQFTMADLLKFAEVWS